LLEWVFKAGCSAGPCLCHEHALGFEAETVLAELFQMVHCQKSEALHMER